MKSIAALFLLAATGVASAQGWTIGKDHLGPVEAAEGGDLRCPTIEEGNRRRPGPAQRDDVSLKIKPYLEPVGLEWLRGALAGENPARDVYAQHGGGVRTLYKSSRITGFSTFALRRPGWIGPGIQEQPQDD